MTNTNELLYMIHQNDEYALSELLGEIKQEIFYEMRKLFYEKNSIDMRPFYEDLLQECYVTIVNSINSYREDRDANFHTYLMKCIINKGFTLLRYIKGNHNRIHMESVSLDTKVQDHYESYYFDLVEQKDPLKDPVFVYEFNEAKERLEDYYNGLSELDQRILLSYIENENYQCAASRLNITEKMYDNHIQRIKKRLKVAIYAD